MFCDAYVGTLSVYLQRPQDLAPMRILPEGEKWTPEAFDLYVSRQGATLPTGTRVWFEVTIDNS